MDLGLSELTDDQLLELLQEACGELAQRDPFVRDLAQKDVFDQAEKLRLAKEAALEAIQQVQREYIAGLKTEMAEKIRAGVKDGTVRLVPPEVEEKEAQEATLETKIALIDEAVANLKRGSRERFFFEIAGDLVTISFGRNRIHATHQLSPGAIQETGYVLRSILAKP